MKPPIKNMNRCLAILMLRAAGITQDNVAGVLHCNKGTVGEVEHWFKELPDAEAASLCDDQALKDAYLFEIGTADQAVDFPKYERMGISHKMSVMALVNRDYVLKHYGKEKAAAKLPRLKPDRHQHYTKLAKAAEELRLNAKEIKLSKGTLAGNITSGYLQMGKSEQQELRNVDRLDAACLLEHLKATFPQKFDGIEDWEKLTNRDKVVLDLSDSLTKKLKEVSHGMALKGTCRICASWLQAP